MLLDNKGKLFGKINIIDLFILLIVVGAVAGAAYKFSTANVGPMAKTEKVVIKFYAEEVSEFVTNAVKEGDPVVDDTKSTYFGNVVKSEVNDSVVYSMTDKGEFIKTTKPGMDSILITAEVDGVMGNNGAIIGGINYGIGHSLAIRAGKAKIWARVYDVQSK